MNAWAALWFSLISGGVGYAVGLTVAEHRATKRAERERFLKNIGESLENLQRRRKGRE
jgi:hypothetical protein